MKYEVTYNACGYRIATFDSVDYEYFTRTLKDLKIGYSVTKFVALDNTRQLVEKFTMTKLSEVKPGQKFQQLHSVGTFIMLDSTRSLSNVRFLYHENNVVYGRDEDVEVTIVERH